MTVDEFTIDEKIKVANLCEKVEDLEESQGHLREKYHQLKMDNKIAEKIEEVEDMNGIVPTMPIGNNCDGFGNGGGTLMGLILGAALGGGGFGGWGGRGAVGGLGEGQVLSAISDAQRDTVNDILATTNMNQNAYNFGNLNTNLATGFGNLNTNLATQVGFLGDKADANALRFTEGLQYVGRDVTSLRDGQAALGRQSAAETLALSEKLCAQGRMTDQQFFQVQGAIKDGDYALARQIADCCCNTQRSIDAVKYENEKNVTALRFDMDSKFCATNAHITASTQRIIDQMNCDRVKDLEMKLAKAESVAGFGALKDGIVASIAAIGAAAANGAVNPSAPSAAAAAAFGGAAGAANAGGRGF